MIRELFRLAFAQWVDPWLDPIDQDTAGYFANVTHEGD